MSESSKKFVDTRPYAAPAAEKLIEIAKGLRNDKGRKLIADGIEMHECGCMFMWKSEVPDGELPGTNPPRDA